MLLFYSLNKNKTENIRLHYRNITTNITTGGKWARGESS